MDPEAPRARLAIDCLWLKRSLDPSRRDPYAMCCTHIVREGAECVGPFLEDRTPLKLAELIEQEFGGFVPPPTKAMSDAV
mgnify:CR=1 FL=1